MICKHILFTFLNEPELFLLTVNGFKYFNQIGIILLTINHLLGKSYMFQVFLCNSNNLASVICLHFEMDIHMICKGNSLSVISF